MLRIDPCTFIDTYRCTVFTHIDRECLEYYIIFNINSCKISSHLPRRVYYKYPIDSRVANTERDTEKVHYTPNVVLWKLIGIHFRVVRLETWDHHYPQQQSCNALKVRVLLNLLLFFCTNIKDNYNFVASCLNEILNFTHHTVSISFQVSLILLFCVLCKYICMFSTIMYIQRYYYRYCEETTKNLAVNRQSIIA